jgi:copper(I)-binding protein
MIDERVLRRWWGSRQRRPTVGRLSLLLLAVLCRLLAAGERTSGPSSLHVEQAWLRRTPPMAQVEQGSHGGSALSPETTALYVTIRNASQEPEALLAASSVIAAVSELHVTTRRDGILVMQPQPQVAIPAGGRLEMHPGGVHIMLLGLTRALLPGDTVPVVLTFRRTGLLTVDAQVQ